LISKRLHAPNGETETLGHFLHKQKTEFIEM